MTDAAAEEKLELAFGVQTRRQINPSVLRRETGAEAVRAIGLGPEDLDLTERPAIIVIVVMIIFCTIGTAILSATSAVFVRSLRLGWCLFDWALLELINNSS